VLQVQLYGLGPFRLPVLTELGVLLETPKDNDLVIAEFSFQEHKRVLASIYFGAVEQLVKADESTSLNQNRFCAHVPLDLLQSDVTYDLPAFLSFNGYIERGPQLWSFVLSTCLGQDVLFPLDRATYKILIDHLSAALYFRARRRGGVPT